MNNQVNEKKIYRSPRFLAYGKISDITKSGNNSARSDSGSNMMSANP
jgi:hypothetical protein